MIIEFTVKKDDNDTLPIRKYVHVQTQYINNDLETVLWHTFKLIAKEISNTYKEEK